MIEALSVSPNAAELSGRKPAASRPAPEGEPDFATLATAEAVRDSALAAVHGDVTVGPVDAASDPRRGVVDATVEMGRLAEPAHEVARSAVSAPAAGSSGTEPAGEPAAAVEGAKVETSPPVGRPPPEDGAGRGPPASVTHSAPFTRVAAWIGGPSIGSRPFVSASGGGTEASAADRWSGRPSASASSPFETAETPSPVAGEMRGAGRSPPSPAAEQTAANGSLAPGPGVTRAIAEASGSPRIAQAAPASEATTVARPENAAATAASEARVPATGPAMVGDAENAQARHATSSDPRHGMAEGVRSENAEMEREVAATRSTPPGDHKPTWDGRWPAALGDVGSPKPAPSTMPPERMEGPPTPPGTVLSEETPGGVRPDLGAPAAGPAQAISVTSGGPSASAAGRPVAEEAAVRIASAVDGRGGSVELRLDPPELGLVRVSLSSSEGGAHALVIAERPETAELLRRHAELLAKELASAGQGRVDVEVSTGGRGGFARDDGARPAPNPSLEAETKSDPAAGPRPVPSAASGGLDLRF